MTQARTIAAWIGSVALALARSAAADTPTFCQGEYAEDLSAMSQHAREVEQHAAAYSYAVRTTATYECVSYGSDGALKKTRTTAVAHGTAFGYRRDGGDTLLVTNQHVAEWPTVTDDDHPVDGVPLGCKRVGDALKIVDDDRDDYAADDVPLTRVVIDPALDIAILRAHAQLEIIPWRVGKSAALVARDVVEVRGFPLGEFRATNVGKVISAYTHDDQGAWNHDDFVVDALLTSGGSGSPVLAVSCKTGELELVGVFHARYSGASALNVVVAIDQVRDLMTTLKRSPRPSDPGELDAGGRARVVELARSDRDPPFFAVGALTASVRARGDGTLVFAVYGSEFPRASAPVVVIEDVAADDGKAFGKLGGVYIDSGGGLVAYAIADADADSQAVLARALAVLRKDALAGFEYRAIARAASGSRGAYEQASRNKRALARTLDGQRDVTQALLDLVGRVPARTDGHVHTLAALEAGTK
jgi:serine protease Do